MDRPLNVLIVEDSLDDTELIVHALRRGGKDPSWTQVETADDLRAALAAGVWDCVVSDYSLPEFGARAALEMVRKLNLDMPFIVVSGSLGDEIAVELMRAGASDYVPKQNLTRLSPALDRELREADNRRARKQADTAMQASEARYRRLFEAAQDGILIVDAQSRLILDVNPFLTKLLGYERDELIGKELWEIGLFQDIEANKAAFQRLQEHGYIRYNNHLLSKKNGSQIEVEFVNNMYDAGSAWVIQCNIRDVTERKQAETALETSENRLRQQSRLLQSILDNMGDGVVVADEAGKFLLFNPAAEEMLGQGMTESRPNEWQERYRVYLPDGSTPYPTDEMPLVKALRGMPSDGVEMLVDRDRNLKPSWISVNARPMWDEAGVLRGGIAVFRNVTDKRLAESALRASEQRYRTLVAATAAIVWDTPASGEFDSTQPEWTAFTGQTVAEHRGWGWLNAIHPEDREKSERAWAAAMQAGTAYVMEHRVRRADGEYRQMSARAVPIFDSKKVIREWVGVHTDVTEQKLVETERAKLLTRLTLQIDRMPLAYVLIGPDFRFQHWNPAAERMFGFSAAEVVGKLPAETIVPPEAEALTADLLFRLEAGDMDAHATHANVTKDGDTIECEWHNTPLFGLDGQFQGILSLAQDVTIRRRAEQDVRDSKERLKHVLASSPAVLFTLTITDNTIQGINWISENLQEMLGYKPEDALIQGWWLAQIHPEERDAIIASTHQSLFDKAERANNEYRFRHASGKYVWTRNEIRLIRDKTGDAIEAVGAWSDISGRKMLESQFHQAQKMEAFGQLAGGVAHDFNNLLTVINGYSEMLLQSLVTGTQTRSMVAEIHKAGERSAGLTRQLLAFSRQQVLAPRILNLNDVVTDTDKMLRRLIGEDIRLTTTLFSAPWAVRADPGQIEQVLLNLAVNARDAMPKGGRLTIETANVQLDDNYAASHKDSRPGPYVLLSVTDTGNGMTPEVMTKIFEPFFTTKELGKGTGLGLATVYGIVKQSGGHVTVYSEVGIGTTFKVYLPKSEQALKDIESPSRNLAPPSGTETILLAEDEAAVRRLAGSILRSCGYNVLEAANGDEAVRLATGHDGPIHLLLTDVVMPGTGGRAAAEQMAARRPELRVLFISGYTDDAVIRHGVLREGVNFIQKPFGPLALALKVREVLDAPAKNGSV